jgi:hypothetical protein
MWKEIRRKRLQNVGLRMLFGIGGEKRGRSIVGGRKRRPGRRREILR